MGNMLGIGLIAFGVFLIVIARRGTGETVAHSIFPSATSASNAATSNTSGG